MIGIALAVAYACFALAILLCLYRVLRGPGLPDRVLALDTMVLNAIALLVLFGIDRGTGLYFEAALLFAMLGFISTVAFAKFVLRGDIIE